MEIAYELLKLNYEHSRDHTLLFFTAALAISLSHLLSPTLSLFTEIVFLILLIGTILLFLISYRKMDNSFQRLKNLLKQQNIELKSNVKNLQR